MRPRCLWTGTHSDRAIEIEVAGTDRLGRPAAPETITVLPEHEADIRAYAARAQRYSPRLLFGILGLTALAVVAAVLGTFGVLDSTSTVWTVGGCVAGMGILMMAVPLATPETVQAFGARRSIQIARASGLLTLAIGLAIGFFG